MLAIRLPAIRLPDFSFLFFVPLLFAPLASPLAAGGGARDQAPPHVRLVTTLGDIVIELDERHAPVTVKNFLRYVDDGFYDDTIFHRVIEGFMIQGGGFTDDFARKRTRAPIVNEANNGQRNRRYTIAMARTNAPHSATSQFFINTVDNPNLDHSGATPRGWGYTVFGRVVEGREVVDRIGSVATGPGGPFSRDAPREPVVILEARRLVPPLAEDAPLPVDAEPDMIPAPATPETDEAADEQRGEQTAAGEVEHAG